MKTLKAIITTALFSLSHAFAVADKQAQIYPSSASSAVDGIPITAVYRDNAGLLWVGSQYGLYRLNGYEDRLFSSTKSANDWIPASDIRAITETTDGSTLAATFGGGVLKFDNASNSFRQIQWEGIKTDMYIRSIYYSRSDWLWIVSTERLHTIDLNGKPISEPFLDSIKNLSTPIKVTGNGDNLVVLATQKEGLWLIDQQKELTKRIDHPDGTKIFATAVSFDKQQGLYVGAEDGQILYFPNVGQNSSNTNARAISSVSPPISSIETQESKIWIGTSIGLYELDTQTYKFKKFDANNSDISNSHVTDLFTDGATTWVGTYQGLSKARFSEFDTIDKKRGGISDDVLAFEEDVGGNLWVGTYAGLYRLNRLERENSAEKIHTADSQIMTLARKGTEIWIGFRQAGIQIIDSETLDNVPSDFLPKERLAVTKILHDCQGRTWVGTFGNGLFLIRNNEVFSLKDEGIFDESFVTILFELSDCTLLLGTETAIYRYDENDNVFVNLGLNYPDAPEPALILSLAEASTGTIWLGTKDRGVFSFKSEQFNGNRRNLKKWEGYQKLADVSVYGMELDDSDNLWISTQVGLFKLGENGEVLDHFDKSEGLQGNDFNFGASFKDSRGQLYFGGINGFSRFDPNEPVTSAKPSDLLLAGIEYNVSAEIKTIDTPKFDTIVLDHHNHFITFQFSVLDFIDPENNKFRHKLENFDPDWIDIGKRNSTTYTNLPPGEYVFRVQGSNSAGIWNREGLSINVVVLPPPWQTWWAYTAYAISLLILFWLGARTYRSYTLRQTKARLELEMHENSERAYDELHEQFELHDNLARSAHDHAKNTLHTISEYLSVQRDYLTDPGSAESLKISEGVVAALTTLEACLYYSNDALTGDLRRFTEIRLTELLASSTLDTERLISINEVTDRRLPAEIATPLSIFINEALENALQHAFEESNPVNYLQVSLEINTIGNYSLDNEYSLSISDSGIGIPSNVVPENLETAGFKTMYSIAEELSGEIAIQTDAGTRITLTFRKPSGD